MHYFKWFLMVLMVQGRSDRLEVVSTSTQRSENGQDKFMEGQLKFWIGSQNTSCQLKDFIDEMKTIVEGQVKSQNVIINENKKNFDELFKSKQEEILQLLDAKIETKMEQIFRKYTNQVEKLLQSSQPNFAVAKKPESCRDENVNKSQALPRNCLEVRNRGYQVTGIYTIQPTRNGKSFDVRCNMDTHGGGWTYILNRFDGSQDFYLKWVDYKAGFGNLTGEFWLGLDHLFELSGTETNELLVEFLDWDDDESYAMYSDFRIGKRQESYPIKVLAGYSGNAGDSLTSHVNLKFSTYDRDRDEYSENCARNYHGAWWYKACHSSQLTGTYFHGYSSTNENVKGMTWYKIRGDHYSLKEARMMVRPRYTCD